MKILNTYNEIRKISIEKRLGKLVKIITEETWETITDYRYPADLRNQIKSLITSAKKRGIGTEDYETQLNQAGFRY